MQLLGFDPQFAGGNLQEVPRQAGNIFAALAQRRQMNANHVQAVEQVLTELSFLHTLLKVLVGCRNNSHVYLHRRIAANAIELAIGQHAQQARLYIKRHIADLIEEQSPTVSLLKTSLTYGIGAGKCPFFVTEKFRFDQVFWDCSHIQCDKRRFCPRAMAVQGVRNQLFTGTGFAVDQYAD